MENTEGNIYTFCTLYSNRYGVYDKANKHLIKNCPFLLDVNGFLWFREHKEWKLHIVNVQEKTSIFSYIL